MTLSRTSQLLVSAAAFVIVVGGLKNVSGIVAPLMLALALTIVFHPLRDRLERRMPTWLASVVLLVAVYLLVLGLTLALVISIGRMAAIVPEYAPDLDDMAANVGDALSSLGVSQAQEKAFVESLDVGRVVSLATSFMSHILSVLSNMFFLLALLLFLAFDAANTSRLAAGAREHRPNLVDALSAFAHGTRTYLGVSAVFGLIVAVIDSAMLYALGIPGAFAWGVLAFVTNFIPNIGFVIGVIPPAIVALLDGGPALMITVIVLYSLVNVVIQSIIQPRFVGSAVGLSTTLTFVSLFFWTWVLGPLGALMAVPMSLLVRAILVDADPERRWMVPLISAKPADEGAATKP